MYKIKLWNRQYGDKAKFIIFNSQTKKYTEFLVDHVQDVVWTNHDLTKEPEYKSWENWNDEPVDFLENIMM